MEVQVGPSTSYKAFKSCHNAQHTHRRRQRWLSRQLRSTQEALQGRCSRQLGICCLAQAEQQGSKHKVVILGGTGRVGSSTAVALLKKDPNLEIVVGSREKSSFDRAVKKRPKLADARFEKVRRLTWSHACFLTHMSQDSFQDPSSFLCSCMITYMTG